MFEFECLPRPGQQSMAKHCAFVHATTVGESLAGEADVRHMDRRRLVGSCQVSIGKLSRYIGVLLAEIRKTNWDGLSAAHWST